MKPKVRKYLSRSVQGANEEAVQKAIERKWREGKNVKNRSFHDNIGFMMGGVGFSTKPQLMYAC